MPSRILRLWNPDAAAWEEVGDSRLTTHLAAADPHTGYVLETLADAKGDLLAASAADTVGRLPLGTDGQVLTADSAQALGVKWAEPAAGGGGSGGAMVRIAEQVLAAAAATITFSSIPQTYRDLRLVVTGRSPDAVDYRQVRVQFNGDTGNNYDSQEFNTTGTGMSGAGQVAAASGHLGWISGATATAGHAGGNEATLFHYTGAYRKMALCQTSVGDREAIGDNFIQVHSVRWRSTAALTAITLLCDASGTFGAGTVATLYGVGGAGGAGGIDAYTKTESDARFLQLTGGTLSGDLTLSEATPTLSLKQAADTQPRSRLSDTALAFGPGGSTAPDATLSRTGAGALSTGGPLVVGGLNPATVDSAAGTNLLLKAGSGGGNWVLVDPPGNVFAPNRDNGIACGQPGNRFTVFYATTGTINTSSREAKEGITPLDPAQALEAVRATPAVTFTYKAPPKPPEYYDLPDDPLEAQAVLEQRARAGPLEEAARTQAGFVAEDAHSLFLTGEGQTNPSNTAGILLAACQELDRRLSALEGA